MTRPDYILTEADEFLIKRSLDEKYRNCLKEQLELRLDGASKSGRMYKFYEEQMSAILDLERRMFTK